MHRPGTPRNCAPPPFLMADPKGTASDAPTTLNVLAQAMREAAKQSNAAIFLVLQRQYETEVVIDLAAPWNCVRHRGEEIRVKPDPRASDEHNREMVTASVAVILTLEDVTLRVAEAMRGLKLNVGRTFEQVHKLRVVEPDDPDITG